MQQRQHNMDQIKQRLERGREGCVLRLTLPPAVVMVGSAPIAASANAIFFFFNMTA